MTRPRSLVALASLSLLLALTGCGGSTVTLSAAPEANDPSCAAVTVRLPDAVDGQDRRWTDAQATGAWGAPTAAVLLHCGVAVPGPSPLPCQTAGGIDWLIDDTAAPNYRFTTYGTDPAVEVYLDYDRVSARSVLDALSSAVGELPKTGNVCTERAS